MSDVPAQATSNVVIVCPNESLAVTVVGYNRAPIDGATVDLVELTSGLFYTATTNSSGSFSNQVTFGTYKLQIYKDGIMVNQTNIPVFGDTQQQVVCSLPAFKYPYQ